MASKPRSTTAAIVSPDAAAALLHHHNTASNSSNTKVSKEIVDELLLVCGVIGTTTERNDELVPVTDCLNWLQDLQRALRRDDDQYRPISLLLSQWHIVEQKLLPLVLTARYDTAMVLTVCKILVILTKPLSDQAVRAGRMAIVTQMKPVKKTKANNSSNSQATTAGGASSIDITKEDDDDGEEEEEGVRPIPTPVMNQAKSKKNMKEVFERYVPVSTPFFLARFIGALTNHSPPPFYYRCLFLPLLFIKGQARANQHETKCHSTSQCLGPVQASLLSTVCQQQQQ
jgi:hypothetical protein